MISFGELRKRSLEWRTEISTVEKIYALDWLLKGIFDRAALTNALTLRGASALANAYFAEYPRVGDIDFARGSDLNDAELEQELTTAAKDAANESGLVFRLHSFQASEARFEFTGPLGRRSAAQPLIVMRFRVMQKRAEPAARPLIHRFSDPCPAMVRAVALEELAAERIVLYALSPRAHDVYDLWFILTHGAAELDLEKTRKLVRQIAAEKKVTSQIELSSKYAPLLARGWENALKEIPNHPTFETAQEEIMNWIAKHLANHNARDLS